MRMTLPTWDIGDFVALNPIDGIIGRVVEVIRTADGWHYSVRYIDNSEAKTIRCFPDELEGETAEERQVF